MSAGSDTTTFSPPMPLRSLGTDNVLFGVVAEQENDMAANTSILNGLIETSKDGEKGFRTAADEARDPELKQIFLARAEDCAKGATQLQKIVARYGGEPETGGSVAGAVHRGWVNLK
jgi:hypothetical protein